MTSGGQQCQVNECPKGCIALGFCRTHYAQHRRGKLPDYSPTRSNKPYTYKVRPQAKGLTCAADECARLAIAFGLCDAHYQQRQANVVLRPVNQSRAARGCREANCPNPHDAHGYCSTHYSYAVGRAEIATGNRRPVMNDQGYVRLFIPGHPRAQKTGYVFEHIVVMTEILGRQLLPGETVHHRNGIRSDNRPENLELWVHRQCKGQRVEDMIPWAKEILARYEPESLAS